MAETITPAQSRAARGLLGWTQDYLGYKSDVSRKTIAEFEERIVRPTNRTMHKIVGAFEIAGIIFLERTDFYGPGVHLSTLFEEPGIRDALRRSLALPQRPSKLVSRNLEKHRKL